LLNLKPVCVRELEAGLRQAVDEIDAQAFEHRAAQGIDQQFGASTDVEFEIILAPVLFEAQPILQTGTAAAGNENAQTGDRILG